jgi:hypothetical protein
MSVQFMPVKEPKTKSFTIPLTLTMAQDCIDKMPARFKLIRAGRKFGKSTYGEYSCICHAGKPNSVVWFAGPTYHQAKLIAWKEFKNLIPREALAKKPNETDLYFTLKNGSEIYVMGSDNPDSLRGPAPDHVVIEEAAMHKPEVWNEVVRPNLTAKCGTADFITTPKGFNWFKDLEDQARKQIKEGSFDWAVFHYSIYDNPHIKRQEIEDAHRDCDSEVVWRQEYLAQYESSVGRVFSAFSDERHCKPFERPNSNFVVYRAIDYGMRDDTACLWATIQGNKLIVFREHLQSDTPASVQAALIQAKTGPNERVERNVISHDAAKEDIEMRGLTVKWHFENAGLRPMYISSRDKKSSRHMIQRLLQEDRLVIDPETCPKLKKQLLAYEWKDTTMERTADGHDDAVDALHYLVETLQHTLFMDRPKMDAQSLDQIYREIADEKASYRPHLKVEGKEELTEFKFDDTYAGYFQ